MSSEKLRNALICGGLALLTLVTYAGAVQLPFTHRDDDVYVGENRHVLTGLSFKNTVWAFTTNHANNWHPLTWLSLQCDAQLFPPDQIAAGVHAVNVIFHALNVLLVFWLLCRLIGTVWPSAFIAAVFAVHPLHVESVAWASERKDVLSTFFGLSALIAYLYYAYRPSVGRYFAVCALFILGLLAKPMLVTLPAVMLLFDYWPLGRTGIRDWGLGIGERDPKLDLPQSPLAVIIEKLPLFFFALVVSAVTYYVQSTTGAVSERMTAGERLQLVAWGYTGYLYKMIWPVNLGAYPKLSNVSPVVTLAQIMLLATISLAAVWAARHGRRYVLVGWLWYVGMLVPVIGFVPVGDQSMADRYMYVPMLGILLILTLGIAEGVRRFQIEGFFGPLAALLVAGLLAVCAVASSRQIFYWNGDEALALHTIGVNPQNSVAWSDLGCIEREKNNLPRALRYFEKALAINPSSYHSQSNIGLVLMNMNRLEEAIAHLQASVRMQPLYTIAHYNLGLALARTSHFDDAKKQFSIAVEQDPDMYMAQSDLAKVLEIEGHYQEAINRFQIALEIKPDFEEARKGLQSAKAKLKK